MDVDVPEPVEMYDNEDIDEMQESDEFMDTQSELEPPQKKQLSPIVLAGGAVAVLAVVLGAAWYLQPPFLSFLPFVDSPTSTPDVPPPAPGTPTAGGQTPEDGTTPPAGSTDATAPPSPPPAPAVDPWREGINKGTNAANLAQNAQTKQAWEAVANEWQAASDLLKQVPADSPNYQAARERVTSYAKNADAARKKAAASPQ